MLTLLQSQWELHVLESNYIPLQDTLPAAYTKCHMYLAFSFPPKHLLAKNPRCLPVDFHTCRASSFPGKRTCHIPIPTPHHTSFCSRKCFVITSPLLHNRRLQAAAPGSWLVTQLTACKADLLSTSC